MTLQPRTKPRRLPLLPLLARWIWLLPSLLVLAAWGRSFQVIDAVQFGSWALVTRVPATVEVTWPVGIWLADHAHWHTTIRQYRVDPFFLPALDAKERYLGTFPTSKGKIYETTIQIPFWALLLPTLPLIPMPWRRSAKSSRPPTVTRRDSAPIAAMTSAPRRGDVRSAGWNARHDPAARRCHQTAQHITSRVHVPVPRTESECR